ncbi:DUF3397 family protein [Ureibacillus sp. FSL K6-8385]|uniref:DUF3397 domain-containing protein n=1 Tax=Ureibacillus terrenus TaxID=118246 RepID=A0A540V5W0_9BACL|nr:DUF3397 family protein [Ureibacillus terrenus]MED3660306.1 DUF3397 family protein [Ureibacillus terrenus]MED3762462.1 DUF3397 family protein [Ureibacillus terrenus]TQE91533.1 DUF3397 domain-containing protein [Ureibacillus terrenus]
MKLLVSYILGILIFIPVTIFILSYFIFRKILKKRANQSVRLAADITTFFLFFSVTISIATLWGTRLSLIAIAISLLIAIIMTYQDWKTKKEMKIIPLLRKIWRVQFLYLVLVYNAVWLVGIVQSILFFIT